MVNRSAGGWVTSTIAPQESHVEAEDRCLLYDWTAGMSNI